MKVCLCPITHNVRQKDKHLILCQTKSRWRPEWQSWEGKTISVDSTVMISWVKQMTALPGEARIAFSDRGNFCSALCHSVSGPLAGRASLGEFPAPNQRYDKKQQKSAFWSTSNWVEKSQHEARWTAVGALQQTSIENNVFGNVMA